MTAPSHAMIHHVFHHCASLLRWIRGESQLGQRRLWGGFSSHEIPRLEAEARDPHAFTGARLDALWNLASWSYCHERYADALSYLDQVTALGHADERRFLLLRAQCLLRTRASVAALEQIANALLSRKADLDLLLLRFSALRIASLAAQSAETSAADQLAALNRVFALHHLAELRLSDARQPVLLDNLASPAKPSPALTANATVSVLVPVFNAAKTLPTALQSLLAQTHTALEIIVADDGSSDASLEIAREFAARDRRIRVLPQPGNTGAYATRNRALAAATGEFVTTHDADDWSHPEKIARQLARLRAHPRAVACISSWVRVTDDLEIIGAWRPRKNTLLDLNDSSLLVRREVFATVGGWDTVRVSADTEFRERLVVRFGRGAIVVEPGLLSFARVRPDSLTRSAATHVRTAAFGLRWHYVDSYRHWHRQRRGTLSLPDANDAHRPRPFPAPRANLPGTDAPPVRFSLVVIADFTAQNASADWTVLLERFAVLRERIAVYHWRKYPADPHQPLGDAFYAALSLNAFQLLTPGDHVETEVTVVLDPVLLRYPPDSLPSIVTAALVAVGESTSPVQLFDRETTPVSLEVALRQLATVLVR